VVPAKVRRPKAVRTAGVDLSSQDKKSAACVVEWSDGGARIISLAVGITDEEITRLIGEVDKLGIDVPLGWPIAFAAAVAEHSLHGTWPATYRHVELHAYRYRRADIHVWRTVGLPPLSVSTDRIGIPAMRAAAVLAATAPRVALDGSGKVVEVYPAAALKRWGLAWRQYKGRDHTQERYALVAAFVAETEGWLSLSEAERTSCEESDDAFDSLIAACVARAAAIGVVEPIPEADLDAARREGWIALPHERSLSVLAPGPTGRVRFPSLGIPWESTPAHPVRPWLTA
jgi:predicted nuclease with RNAse H fold